MPFHTLEMSEFMSVDTSNTIENMQEKHVLEIDQLFIFQINFPRCLRYFSPLLFPVVFPRVDGSKSRVDGSKSGRVGGKAGPRTSTHPPGGTQRGTTTGNTLGNKVENKKVIPLNFNSFKTMYVYKSKEKMKIAFFLGGEGAFVYLILI